MNEHHLAFHSNEIIDCFKKINVTSEDEKSLKHSSVSRLMNNCVQSKRNYVIDRIKKQMKGKLNKKLSILIVISN